MLSAVVIGLLLTFPGWHEETDDGGSECDVKPFPSRPVSHAAAAAALVSAILLLISSIWQHVAAVAYTSGVAGLSSAIIGTGVGTAAVALLWIAFVSIILVMVGLVVMIISINLLEALIDDDSSGRASTRAASRPAEKRNTTYYTTPPQHTRATQPRWEDGDE